MEDADRLWESLHELFDTDDGSLPDISIVYKDHNAVALGYALLRSRAAEIVTENPYFWSFTDEMERPLDSVPNAAELVVAY